MQRYQVCESMLDVFMQNNPIMSILILVAVIAGVIAIGIPIMAFLEDKILK